MNKNNVIFLSEMQQSISENMINNVYYFLKDLEEEYPGFNDWYFKKVVPSLKNGTREILVMVCNQTIYGVCILKNTPMEKKICTLRVKKEYQFMKVGTILLNQAIKTLNTDKPLITVSSTRLNEFEKLFKNFSFSLICNLEDYYKKGVSEYCFNGSLPQKKIYTSVISTPFLSLCKKLSFQ